ncbi:hypothetical protein FACS189440_11730 [Bacteroidia bacterium]|nr:hypothetical protein FACS189423_05490 [Bacteroidia bacterium]GHT48354.1 hypothetical protein FACS189440_11730 [Bacteroidia bacterium]
MNKKILSSVLASFLSVVFCYGEHKDEKFKIAGNQILRIEEDVTSLLRNPCTGWTLYKESFHNLSMSEDADTYWANNDALSKYASLFLIRAPWAFMEPEEGKYAWIYNENYKKLIQGAIDRGLKLAIRVFSDGYDCYMQATPNYVREAGCEGYFITEGMVVRHYKDYERWSPYPDDPVFKEKITKFVEAFAAEYDNPEIVDYVDAFNLGKGGGEGWGIALKRQTKQYYENVMDWYTDIYWKNFKKVIPVMCFDQQLGYATEKIIVFDRKGFATRRDGLGSSHFSATEQAFTHQMYGKIPLFGEGFAWPGYDKNPPTGTDSYIHTWRDYYEYLFGHAFDNNFNTLDLRDTRENNWLSVAPDLVEKFIVEGGYRLYPSQISLPSQLKKGKKAVIGHNWLNTGNGYLPNNVPNWGYKYQTAFALLNQAGEAVKIWVDENAEPSQWLRGHEYPYQLTVNVDGIAKGDYQWAVAIVDKTKNNTPGIKLAIKDKDVVNGWTVLMPVNVK